MIELGVLQQLLASSAEVIDVGGASVGSIRQVYLDDRTNAPAWVSVRSAHGEVFVPLVHAAVHDGRLAVAYPAEVINASPRVMVDGPLPAEAAAALAEHYRPLETPAPPEPADATMTRSEERLSVGVRTVPVGRARLRKYLVTEQRTITVPVRREEVRVEYAGPDGTYEAHPAADGAPDDLTATPSGPGEPPPDASAGAVESADLAWIVLYEEQVEVRLHKVPRERVRLTTETVTETQQVSGTVRRENVVVETADSPGRHDD